MTDIKNIIGTHMWPGKVRIDVENDTCSGKVKVSINTGDISFSTLPDKYKFSSDHLIGRRMENIPIIYIGYGGFWINMTPLTKGKFISNEGDTLEFPCTMTIEYAENLLKAFDIVINKLVEENYIKVELLTTEEMVDLLDSGILPSEISRYGWRLYKAYAMQHKDVTRYWDILTRHCALCETYQPCPSSNCPLRGEDYSCASGLYNKSCNTESNEAFTNVCDLMIAKINEAVIKEREVKEEKCMKEKIPMNYKFGKIEITVNESEDDDYPDMFTLTIEGMKEYKDLPDEYLSGYPRCYYDNDDDSFKLRCSDGYIMESDGSHDCEYGDWLYTTENAEADYFSMETVKEIVEEIEKCVERLRVINNSRKGDEILFNRLNDNVDSVTYDFNGCIVKVTRTNYEDVYKININPGEFVFKRKFAAMRKTYSFEHGSYGYDWRINEKLSGDRCNFDTDKNFSVNDINKILTHIKKEVENITNKKEEIIKVKLMTADDVKKLIDKSDLLPSEISKKKWEIYKEYCIQNDVFNKDLVPIGDSDIRTCALCVVYKENCDLCPLKKVSIECKDRNSVYRNVINYSGENKKEFIKRIDNMINVLDKTIEYEEKEKSKGDLVEIPNYSYTFNFNGVIVDSRSIGNGLFRVSISDSNHRIHNSYTIKINNESIRCHMWPDMSHKYDWYLSCDVLENLINTDKRSFNSWFGNSGLFNNGITLSHEGTELLVTLVKKCAESEE